MEAQLSAGRVEQERLEAALAEDAPRLAAAQDTWYRLSALAERLAGTVRLAQERARHLAGAAEARAPGRDPDELDAEADAIAEQEEALVAAVVEARRALSEITEARTEHERTLAAAERAHLAAVRALADRRAGLATLAGRAEALRSGAAATAEEIERLSDALAEAQERTAAAEAELAGAREELGALTDGDTSLEERGTHTAAAHEAARGRVAELVAQEREAEQQRAHWRARVEALSVGLARRDGSAAIVGAEGVLGTVSALVAVEAEARTAVAAALGELADGLAVADLDAAVAALATLRDGRRGPRLPGRGDARRRSLSPRRCAAAIRRVVASGDRQFVAEAATIRPDRGHWRVEAAACGPARWAADAVAGDGPVAEAVRALLQGVVLVADGAAARRVVAAGLTAVTADGDVLGPHRASGGSGGGGSALDVQAAVDDATAALAKVEEEVAGLRPALDGARAEEAARQADVEAAKREQAAAEQRRAGAAARLGAYEQAVRSATAEAERLRTRRDEVETRRTDALLALEAAEQQLAVAEDEPVDDEPDTEIRDAAAEAVETARSAEVDARLALRTAEERARAIAGRAESLRRQAAAERQARSRAAAARAARERGARIAALVVTAGETACGRIAVSLAAAAEERDAAAAARDSRERELGEARLVVGRLTALMEKLTDAVHRDEVLRAQNRLRLEQLTEKVLADHGLGAHDLVTEYGPDVPVPASAAEMAEYEAARERGEDVTPPPPMPYDRATQQRRASRAEKDLALLGKVNPLALEEFAALEERYRFLSTQLEDLKNTRRDLLTVVREVDDKILEVFTEAYSDVAREFVTVFATLFPGGEGRLVLTDPEDMLTTGIEVEARPPGKKVKRLSLLSGGERSLTAMALLVAIFRARPSPFYVLDEIEAALDDVNLRRLILLMEELRETSQLIVITHQKPTMEVADALYGVSMRGDGITTVISQRLRPAS